MRPTNQQCMTAPESCFLGMPAGLIAASPLTKADCQRPAFDICMGLVTRNVEIRHISLTGPYDVWVTVGQGCVYMLIKSLVMRKAIDLRPVWI